MNHEAGVVYDVLFEGNGLQTVMDDTGEKFVVIRTLTDAMGLNFKSQFRKIENSVVVISTMTQKKEFNHKIIKAIGNDGKTYEMFCLPLNELNKWLLSIKINKIIFKNDLERQTKVRTLVSKFQDRCYQVLNDFWATGIAISTTQDKQLINELNRMISQKDGMIEMYLNKIENLEANKEKLKKDNKNAWGARTNALKDSDKLRTSIAQQNLEIISMRTEMEGVYKQSEGIKKEYSQEICNLNNKLNQVIIQYEQLKAKTDQLQQIVYHFNSFAKLLFDFNNQYNS